ncbi:MAG: ribosomal protein S18-alanine N-acetyltransferase [Clostridiales bacterium]|nr:ribosomal protein S18-alanine N-acetyltransferase [Clostridiales bacterium]
MSSFYRIERLNGAHIPGLARLEEMCSARPWSGEALRAELDNPHAVYFAAVGEQGGVLGYLGFHAIAGEGYITNVAVDEAVRRRGIGGALIQAAVGCMRAYQLDFLTLEVRAGNRAAQALYEKHGFRPVGRRKNFYTRPTEDAVLMTLERERDDEHSGD